MQNAGQVIFHAPMKYRNGKPVIVTSESVIEMTLVAPVGPGGKMKSVARKLKGKEKQAFLEQQDE